MDQETKHFIDALARAADVLGLDEAKRWLDTPVRGLGNVTPLSLLETEEGRERVYDILGQLEHGGW